MATHHYYQPMRTGYTKDGESYTYRGGFVCDGACKTMKEVLKDFGTFPRDVQMRRMKFCPYCGEPLERDD